MTTGELLIKLRKKIVICNKITHTYIEKSYKQGVFRDKMNNKILKIKIIRSVIFAKKYDYYKNREKAI